MSSERVNDTERVGMTRHRFKIGISLVLAAAATGLALPSSVGFAAEPASRTPAVTSACPWYGFFCEELASDQAAARSMPLHEFRTAENDGTFYTIDPNEAERVARPASAGGYDFRPTHEATGISLYPEQHEGMIALHRLRLIEEPGTYMVARADSSEMRDGRFMDDGHGDAMAFAYIEEQPGTMTLHRYSRDNDWRLARANSADLLDAGYDDDGVVGWVPAG